MRRIDFFFLAMIAFAAAVATVPPPPPAPLFAESVDFPAPGDSVAVSRLDIDANAMVP